MKVGRFMVMDVCLSIISCFVIPSIHVGPTYDRVGMLIVGFKTIGCSA